MADAARTLEEPRRIAPQRGPQMAFASSEADIAIFGGGAGGGKSYALLYEAGKWAHVPGYRAVLFRRTSPQLAGLWDESAAIYSALDGRSRGGNRMDWRFRSGARIEFRHMQLERDRFGHQGQAYAFVGFDELTHFTESQFWYLVGRLRSTCGVRPYMRGTCNPDPDSFVATLIEWWIGEDGYPIPERAGVLRWLVRLDDVSRWYDSEAEAREAHPGEEPLSVTFIPSLIDDNPALLEKDPRAVGNLLAGSRVDRARLRWGNWKVRESSGDYFRREDFVLAAEPPSRIVRTVRAWDKASTKPSPRNPRPDWTRGVRMSLCEGGEIWIDHVESLRDGPAEVLALQRTTAESDPPGTLIVIWRDTGGAGVTDVETTRTALGGFEVEELESFGADTEGLAKSGHRSGRAKRAHARVWTPAARSGRVYVRAGQPWTQELLAELDAFPDGGFDDFVDACSAGARVLLAEQGTSLIEAMAKVQIR